MIELDNQTEHDFSIKQVEQIASTLSKRDIELILCDDNTIQNINKEYRETNSPTDVLSFPLEGELEHMPLGSIVISVDKISEKSMELGHTPQDELTLLFIHGLLHLLGYDHETDAGEMRAKERELIEQFMLPESLIIRTEES